MDTLYLVIAYHNSNSTIFGLTMCAFERKILAHGNLRWPQARPVE